MLARTYTDCTSFSADAGGSRMMQLLNLAPAASHSQSSVAGDGFRSPLAGADIQHSALNGAPLSACMGNGFHGHPQQHQMPVHGAEAERFNMKHFEEGLRQLLPNCTIHFGSSSHRQQQQHQPPHAHHQHNGSQPQHTQPPPPQQKQPHTTSMWCYTVQSETFTDL